MSPLLALAFERPAWLVLALCAALPWFLPRRLRDRVQGALRSLAVLALALALAGPWSLTGGARAHRVVIVDRSASVSEAALGRLDARVAALRRAMPSGDRVVLLELGAPREDGPAAAFDARRFVPPATGLGLALQLAAMEVPRGAPGSVVLASDGRSPDPAWSEAVTALVERGIPVEVLPLAARDGTRLVGVRLEDCVRPGLTTRLEAEVEARDARVALVLEGPGGELGRSAPAVVRGRRTLTLDFEPPAPGFHDLVLRLEASGGEPPRADAGARRLCLAVQEPLSVLYLGGRVRDGAKTLAGVLGQGFAVDSPGTGGDGFALAGHDLVMLDDLPEAELPRELQAGIADAVAERGLGLVMSGGQASFGPGGWSRSPLEKLLPVELVQKEEKKDPSTALAIIIDTSGSMSGNRIVLAKEVARLALRRLLPHDKVGIVEFYGTKRWAAPLQSAANSIAIQRALNRLDAGGGTILYPAVEEAYFGLRNVQTRYKHILILTDGGVETGDYETLLRRISQENICVSTVLVGPGRHSEFLVELADWGRGRYYHAPDRFNLCEILLKQPSSSRLPAWRPGAHQCESRGGRGFWGSVDPEALPPLEGYVETRPRPGALDLLRTRGDGHPVLSTWSYGLGRVTALTTEPVGPATTSWRAADGYGAFLGRILAKSADGRRFPFAVELERRADRLLLRARRLAGTAVPRARLLGAGDEATPLPLVERAPGLWVGSRPLGLAAAAHVVVDTDAPADGSYRAALPAATDAWPEAQVATGQGLDLVALATLSGGAVLPAEPAADYRPRTGGGSRPVAVVRLEPLFCLLALLCFVAELAWRRRPSRSMEDLVG
ncbi:MAG: VWA domain-containing protein [Planctomycetota bacterium]